MKKKFFPVILLFCPLLAMAQVQPPIAAGNEMYFVADTQQPLWFEKILHRSNHNTRATAAIFAELLRRKPRNLYMLGDVVGLGYSKRKWKKVDVFLDSCRKSAINVFGVLGNHEILFRPKKGEARFAKRFSSHVRTGYVSVTDSVAVILLNSNFKSLKTADLTRQQHWYLQILADLDKTDSIKAVIVGCHHAPYSNSKAAGSSAKVQAYFVPGFIRSKKALLFLTGHAHAFEHFRQQGKDFVVAGGGGGLHQQLDTSAWHIEDLAAAYKPMFHYLTVQRAGNSLKVVSYFLKDDFSGFEKGQSFILQPADH